MHAPPIASSAIEHHPTQTEQEYPLVKARQRGEDAEQREIRWLEEKVRAHPGYEQFSANQNQKLSDADRVEFWNFAASFSADLYKAPSPTRVCSICSIPCSR